MAAKQPKKPKINIDDYGKQEVYEKMSTEEILDIIDQHIKEQGIKFRADCTSFWREDIANGVDPDEVRRGVIDLLKYHIWQYGGACQRK